MVPGATRRPDIERSLCPRCRTSNRVDANFCVRCGSSLLLAGSYRIRSVIKEGGMSTVYRAVDRRRKPCAIKELRDQFSDPNEREAGIQRFLDEGELLHSLRDHPAIPKVYRSFVDNGRYYLAMEFIHGEDLEDVLRRHKRFSEAQVLLWADQLCDVLQYLHDNGLIYRDMKPSNVMIARDGHIKVVDFGIAQVLRPGHRGTMIGTPGYAPPEQYQGITVPQSDVYALAATMHHLLTGRDPREHPPFSFPPAHTLNPDVSPATSRALQKALAMEVNDRYATIEAFHQALPITEAVQATRVLDQPTPRKHPTSPVTRSQPPRHSFRRRVRRALLTVLIATGLIYTSDAWAPPLGAAVNEVLERIATELEDSSAAPPQDAPTQGDQAASNTASESNIENNGTRQFRTVVEIEVPEGTSQDEVYAAFKRAFLTKAREQYPTAQLASDELAVIFPDRTQQRLDPEPAGDGNVRYRADLQGTIVTPP